MIHISPFLRSHNRNLPRFQTRQSRTLTLRYGGTISASTKGPASSAIGGSIIINATDQVTMTNGASITASSLVDPATSRSGIANAGDITLNAGRQFDVTNGSSITTTTQSPTSNLSGAVGQLIP